ncbi:MAG TPA: DUF5916 domain-containing protein, partial [Longimicrobiales bacterium]|nr:DUF5916 domain-containing protein [Longimicrobiales bacterium]
HDRRTGFVFGVYAAGVERDIRYANDDESDDTWDAVWDVAVSSDSLGWSAEFRIPFSQLRFSGSGGADEEVVWGIQFSREIARKREALVWSPYREESGVFVSRFGELRGLRPGSPPRRVEVMPYTVARLTRAPGDPDDPFFRANDWGGSFGADVKVGLGPALTLTATLNPDFGQVEADPSVVNLTAFETFFPEKRPFFTEGAEAFGFLGPGVFYSRRVGRRPQGSLPGDAAYGDVPEAATILGAAKLSGKTAGGWSLGILEAVTGREEAPWVDGAGRETDALVEPLTNYAVARISRDFRSGRSYLGGVFTATNRRIPDGSAIDFLHDAAYVAGIDGSHRFAQDRFLVRGSVSGSHVRGSPEAIARTQRSPGHYFQRPDADHLSYDPTRTSLTGMSVFGEVTKVGGGNWRWGESIALGSPGYEVNDMGFEFDNDRIRQSGFLRYVDYSPGGGLRSWSAQASHTGLWTAGGERIDLNATVEAAAELDSGWGGGVWAMRHRGGVDPSVLRGGPALLSPARWMAMIDLFSDRRRPVYGDGMVYLEGEDGTGGSVAQTTLSVTLRPSARAQVSMGPSMRWNTNPWQYVTRSTVDGEDHYVLARLEQRTASLNLRGAFTFTPELSMELWLQPFVSAGAYDRFMTVASPEAGDFDDRFHVYGSGEISTEEPGDGGTVHRIAPGGAPPSEAFTVSPDFNVRQLRSNAVLRWEYRPGSTLFLVWSQDRSAFAPDGRFRLGRDLDGLFGAPSRNVFLVKLSYWMGG